MTIAAENDIIISGNLTSSGNGMLGLVANNFVRVKHPPARARATRTHSRAGSQTNPNIEAAILAINHSFIVDHYDCGATLGALT